MEYNREDLELIRSGVPLEIVLMIKKNKNRWNKWILLKIIYAKNFQMVF